MEEEERRREALRPKETVENRILRQKKRLYRRLSWILGACVLVLLILLLLL